MPEIKERKSNGQITKKYSDEEIKSILEDYVLDKDKKIKDISCETGIPTSTLFYYAKKLGINRSRRKYAMDESYFDIIDTELKAYFLGFIIADGCVSTPARHHKSPVRLIINISSKDRVILEKLKDELNCDYEINDYIPHESTYSSNQMSELVINSKRICDALSLYGVTQSKTGYEYIPDIDEKYLPHLLRGFIDGDGSIENNGKIRTIRITACDKLILEQINNIFVSIGVKSKEVEEDKRGKNAYTLRYNREKDIESIKDFLYKDATFYLDRKYNNLLTQ